MREWRIDLFSDTKTRPDAGMRAAMAEAKVGDEQQDEDPTVAALNDRVADILGKPRAVFLPSGTMANLISILVHCRRGEEILAEASSHVLHLETGGPAGLAGAVVTPIDGRRGMFSLDTLGAVLRTPRRNAPRTRVVWIEQTTNLGGGAVWPLPELQAIKSWVDERGLVLHIDGARLLNASVAGGVDPANYGHVADSLWLDFSKGLGAPFGAVLAGSQAFINEAIRYKHMLGGAMRQAGVMAAACLYALDRNLPQLAKDHDAAKRIGAALESFPGVSISPVETNIVVADIGGTGQTAGEVASRLAQSGIRVGVFGPTTLRLVTHRDVSAAGIETSVAALGDVFGPEAK